MSDFETASSTLSATVAPFDLRGSALEEVRLYTINEGYPSFERYFCRLFAIARPINGQRDSRVGAFGV